MKTIFVILSLLGLLFIAKDASQDPNFASDVQLVCNRLLLQGYDADEAVRRKSPNEERYTKPQYFEWGSKDCDIVVLTTYEDTVLQLTIKDQMDTLVGNIYLDGKISVNGSSANAEVVQSADTKVRNALEHYLDNYFIN